LPLDWTQLKSFSTESAGSGHTAQNPVNSMLNYGYSILAHKIKGQVIAAGLDPTIGIIHGNSENRIPLVYDLMEPLRPVIDRMVLQFALSNTFAPGDFTITKWGGCRLNPQLARAITQQIAATKIDQSTSTFLHRLRT
jgi:CRISP-associated protein Cas1